MKRQDLNIMLKKMQHVQRLGPTNTQKLEQWVKEHGGYLVDTRK